MNGSESPQNRIPTEGILLATANQRTTERYAERLFPEYLTRTATNGRDALKCIDDDTMVVLLGDDLQDMSPQEFLDRARKAGYEGKTALITESHSTVETSESDFDSLLRTPISKSVLLRNIDELVRQLKYENRLDQHFALASKRARLESQVANGELEARKRYTEVIEDLTALDNEIETILGDFEPADFESMFVEVLP